MKSNKKKFFFLKDKKIVTNKFRIFFPLFFTVCSTTLATYSSIFTKKNINIFELGQKQKSFLIHNPKKTKRVIPIGFYRRRWTWCERWNETFFSSKKTKKQTKDKWKCLDFISFFLTRKTKLEKFNYYFLSNQQEKNDWNSVNCNWQ